MRTEGTSRRFAEIDLWATEDAVMAMFEGQLAAAASVKAQVEAIARAADEAAERLRGPAGRLIYVGAGTSGRIAVLDGTELEPTFGWAKDRLIPAIAGGSAALGGSVENAEDDEEAGREALRSAGLTEKDVVIGVAASGTTPFTLAAIREARAVGALTIGLANNAGAPLLDAAEHPILLETGAEIISGSTRMKAGTAQKIALNLLSTAIMLRLGRVHAGLMVDMRISNRKLRTRAIGIVAELAEVDPAAAETALDLAEEDIKLATLVARGMGVGEARALLTASDNVLRRALSAVERG